MSKRYTITAALPYTNGPIHIGHLAGVYVPADIFARYQRLKNNDVAFICGSDEHGVAISIKAKKEGTTPQAIIDKYHAINKLTFLQLVQMCKQSLNIKRKIMLLGKKQELSCKTN